MNPHATEYYGSSKGMPQGVLEERLQKAKEEVFELTAEKARREQFTSTEKLADRLHRLIHAHADCDYYYSNWPTPTGCRHDFLVLAGRVEDWYADNEGHACGDRTLGGVFAILETQIFGKPFQG